MPGIGLISNPRSRLNKADPSRVRKLGYMIGSHGTAEATRSIDDLYRVCEEFKKERIEILGISGGDGTLHHTLTAMIRTYGEDQPLPLIAILRGGTMNTIARCFKIFGEPSRLLFELVDKHRRGLGDQLAIFEKEILQVGDMYGYIFGTGIIRNFMHEYYETGNPSPAIAAQLITRAAASAAIKGPLARRIYRRFEAEVTVDGQTWARRDFATVTAALVKEIGLGFSPYYRCDERPGHFAVLGIHTSVTGFLLELPRIMQGRPMRRDKVIDQVAQHMRLYSDSKVEYIIDGDNYTGDHELVVKTGPKLRFIRLTGDALGETPLPDHPVLPG